VARRGDTLVAGCWSPAGQFNPVYPDSDPAHQQAIAQSDTGQTVSRNGASVGTVG